MRTTVLLLLLTATARADFAETLARAGWSGEATAGDVTLTARQAALFSKGMLEAVRRAPLRDVVRVTFAKPGWFLSTAVEPGTYSIGIETAGEDLQFVLRDAAGKRIAEDGFWVRNPHDGSSSVAIETSNGASLLHLKAGNDKLTWRFIPRAAHEKLAAGLTAVSAGQVTIHTDHKPAFVRSLAQEADKAVAVHARLLGGKKPSRHFHIYLVTDIKKFNAFSDLVDDGALKSRQGFHVSATGHAYVHSSALALGDDIAIRIRSTVLHELHHQVAEEIYPQMTWRWPVWIKEGLAELGAFKALKQHGAEFEKRILGHWTHARLIGTVPHIEDFMGDSVGDPTQPFYAAAYLLAKHHLQKKPAKLHGLLALLAKRVYTNTAQAVARAALTRDWGEARSLYAGILNTADGAHEPVVVWGHADGKKEELRVATAHERAAKVIYPELHDGPTITAETEFRWGEVGQQQADFYLAYSRGKRTSQFLKVAIGPGYVMLFWQQRDKWETIGRVNYDTKLPAGKWLPLKVTYDSRSKKVRVETEGGRWAAFDCPHLVPLGRTRVGVGGYHSVVWWKKPKVGP